jgi:hypothetical protein
MAALHRQRAHEHTAHSGIPGDLAIGVARHDLAVTILLTGSDKSGNWSGWYKQAIPRAEDLYKEYLKDARSRRSSDEEVSQGERGPRRRRRGPRRDRIGGNAISKGLSVWLSWTLAADIATTSGSPAASDRT